MIVFDTYFLVAGPDYFSVATKIVMLPVYIFPVVAFIVAYRYLIDGHYKIARNIFSIFTILAIITSIDMTGGFFESIASPFLVVVPVMVFLLYGMRAGAIIAVAVPFYMFFQSIFLFVFNLNLPNYTSMANPDLNVITTNLALYLLVIAMVASYEYQRANLKKNLDTERKKLAALVNCDPLTDLSNSRHFYTELNKQHAEAIEKNRRLVVMYLDLNRFKIINDNFGHQVGDRTLVEIADRIKKCASDFGIVARIGGDEFAILINDDISDRTLENLKKDLVNAVRKPTFIDGISHVIGTSIGHSVFPDDCTSVAELLKKADDAMYKNKKQGILDQAEKELQELPHTFTAKSATA
jgi:diguanylate cyclase (GGDEF)-like protein